MVALMPVVMTNEQILVHAEQHYFLAQMQWLRFEKAAAIGSYSLFEKDYADGDFKVKDIGEIRMDGSVDGSIQISYQDRSVWCMRYLGYHRPEDELFLKKILLDTYSQGKFYGGRGPVSWGVENPRELLYTNKVDWEHCSFRSFRGTEEIRGFLQCLRGALTYWGGSLLK